MAAPERTTGSSNFRKFFVRGLAILLPTVLTIWILLAAYNFVQTRIAEPINQGIRVLVVRLTSYPAVVEQDIQDHEAKLKVEDPARLKDWRESDRYRRMLRLDTRRAALRAKWDNYKVPLDLIGLVVAIFLIYMVGGLLGSLIGRRIVAQLEYLVHHVPVIRHIYPSVKQVTDFFVGGAGRQLSFTRVVAVEYPRKGLWSIGLVTGDTMKSIQHHADHPCVTVFIPSSPTPFTGYVITVPRADTIDLNVSIDDALRFTISGGVIVPPAEQLPPSESAEGQPKSRPFVSADPQLQTTGSTTNEDSGET